MVLHKVLATEKSTRDRKEDCGMAGTMGLEKRKSRKGQSKNKVQ
jgi:hypothetical protein